MEISIRVPTEVAEYRTIAELMLLTRRDRTSPEQLLADDREASSSTLHSRRIAVDAHGAIVGMSLLRSAPWISATSGAVSLAVSPAHRHQGIETRLYADVVAQAKASGITAFVTTMRDDCPPEARSFAEHCGFVLTQHWVYWQLALSSFDETPFVPAIERLQAQSMRFFSFVDTGNTAEAQHKLYDLNRRTSLDAPGEDSFPTFTEFVQDIIQADWFRPESQFIAADGDDWVGLVANGLDGHQAFVAFTGVDRVHRRRGIALALTLLGIRYARQQNATYLEVMNDSRNIPMFALQEQLGYQRVVGNCILEQAAI